MFSNESTSVLLDWYIVPPASGKLFFSARQRQMRVTKISSCANLRQTKNCLRRGLGGERRRNLLRYRFDIAIVENMSVIHDDGMPAMLRTYFGMLPDVEAN